MDASTLTVFFEDPFWVGLYERTEEGRYTVCRVVFGPEPKDYEVYDFLLKHWRQLPFSPGLEAAREDPQRKNPKRIQREIRRSLSSGPTGTKAQQALQLQREANKQVRKTRSREEKEAEEARKYAFRQEKKKAKHRGK
ncbi:MAG: YjdF family protein [Bacillota bacterium]|nr:YjdF family protein [Bacillota bacterium]